MFTILLFHFNSTLWIRNGRLINTLSKKRQKPFRNHKKYHHRSNVNIDKEIKEVGHFWERTWLGGYVKKHHPNKQIWIIIPLTPTNKKRCLEILSVFHQVGITLDQEKIPGEFHSLKVTKYMIFSHN